LNVALTRLNRLKPVIVNIILFTCYMIAMPWLGFITSTFIYLVTAQTFLTTEKLKALPVILCVAVVFSAGPYFMFSELFNIYLPRAQW
ncbi:MAG: tripartite tricarboxylate transporter TctB family protein, partial [Halomonas sp.]|nr:tripartite tricarboxylate transporter TctB family protein [Halomonas sp.]